MTRAPTKSDPAADAASDIGMAATDPRRRVQRRRYKIRGAETWALIRESYLAGAPARELATRYDVTEWAIWRRAWRQGWTKQDRVEAPPPPALTPVMPHAPPAAEVDPAALTRLALNGLAEALRQNRLAEARNLAQIVASLGRIGGGLGGQYTLADMVRVIFDRGYQVDVMRMDPDRQSAREARLLDAEAQAGGPLRPRPHRRKEPGLCRRASRAAGGTGAGTGGGPGRRVGVARRGDGAGGVTQEAEGRHEVPAPVWRGSGSRGRRSSPN